MPTKTTKKQKVAKPKKEKVPATHKKAKQAHHLKAEVVPLEAHVKLASEGTAALKQEAEGRYIFATGRRKTSIANVRLFTGKGENIVNKKPFDKYFSYSYFAEEGKKPFDVTGLLNQYHFICQINGGGLHSQAGALKHGLATALSQISPEVRKILKKNSLLTRDDRKKERKKPGLKRARRAPQWAKR